MARFQILATRKLGSTEPFEGTAEFDIAILTSPVKIGDSFTVYDTHHPIEYQIIDIEEKAGCITLRCKPGLGFDRQFEGGLVDTEGSTRTEKFHYPKATSC